MNKGLQAMKRGKRKILFMGDPVTKAYHDTANLTAVIMQDESAAEWICGNFIQLEAPFYVKSRLYTRYDYTSFQSLFDCCPFIIHSIQEFNMSTQCKQRNYIQILVDLIETGHYIYTWHDQFYISISKRYRKEHFIHDIFVYGYDNDLEVIYCTEFYNFKYEHFVIPYTEFNDAVDCQGETLVFNLIKYRGNEYSIDLTGIVEQLNYYNNSSVHSEYIKEQDDKSLYRYGLNVYKALNEYLEFMLEIGMEYDTRPFFVVWEHKKIMLYRLYHLYRLGNLNKESYYRLKKSYEVLENQTLILMNLHLKYAMTSDIKYIMSMKEKIEIVERMDAEAVLDLINSL